MAVDSFINRQLYKRSNLDRSNLIVNSPINKEMETGSVLDLERE